MIFVLLQRKDSKHNAYYEFLCPIEADEFVKNHIKKDVFEKIQILYQEHSEGYRSYIPGETYNLPIGTLVKTIDGKGVIKKRTATDNGIKYRVIGNNGLTRTDVDATRITLL